MLKKILHNSSEFESAINKITNYDSVSKPEVISTVSDIISDVKVGGNVALFEYTKKFDNFDINLDNFLMGGLTYQIR